ncbi:MAG: IPT/TIG domain-containing protein, partial [Acidobacteria bacterium]|nr:IPT/TIG domain-containing protein [Acidobacteriota bacterium]
RDTTRRLVKAELLPEDVDAGCSAPGLNVTANNKNQINLWAFYDAAGNALCSGCVEVYRERAWARRRDAENRLSAAAGVNYKYDAEGQRVIKDQVSGSTYDRMYWHGFCGGSKVLMESDFSGGNQTEYIYFNGQRIARRDPNGSVYYFFDDTLGNTRVTTNATGGGVDDMDPYPHGGSSAALPFTINAPLQAAAPASRPGLEPPRSTPDTQPAPTGPPPRVLAAPIAAPTTRLPSPVIVELRPAFAVAGGGTLRLTVRGENFTEESVVRWKGKELPTKFIRETELEVEVPAEALAQPGELKLTVFTPGPTSGSSKPATVQVTSP